MMKAGKANTHCAKQITFDVWVYSVTNAEGHYEVHILRRWSASTI